MVVSFWFAGEAGSSAGQAGRPAEGAADGERDDAGEASASAEGGDTADQTGEAPLADFLPWTISLLFHAGLVLVASFIIWSVQGPPDEAESVVPSTELGETPPAKLETTAAVETTDERSQAEAESSASNRASLQSTVDTAAPLIGAESVSGEPSPFGTSRPAGEGAEFMGADIGGDVRRLVFLIDASGSLIDSLPFVINQLKTTIRELSPRQSFTVIFFRGKEYFDEAVLEVPVPEVGLKKATPQTKRAVTEWISLENGNVVPGGEAPPLEAIRRALRYDPQLVVILSDDITGTGQHQIDQDRLLAKIKQLSTGGTVFNTIQFLYPDPLAKVPGKKGTLRLIAEQSGGTYKFVDEAEVSR